MFCKLCGTTEELTNHHIWEKGHPYRHHKDYITILCDECHQHYSRLEFSRGRAVKNASPNDRQKFQPCSAIGKNNTRMVGTAKAHIARTPRNGRGRRQCAL